MVGARADLRLVVAFVARDSPDAAERLGRAVMLAERGRVVPELDDPAVRYLLLGSHRVVYEVFPDRVGIARIIHGSRNLRAAWGRRK